VVNLVKADAQLREEARKAVDDPTRRAKAVFQRALDRRHYIAQQITGLGGWPWKLNWNTAEFDGFLPPFNPDEEEDELDGA